MGMIWDAPLVAATAKELHSALAGARLRAHRFRWEERELHLYLRSGTLKWFLHPEAGWVTLSPPTAPPEDAKPLQANVVGIEAPADERIIRIHLRRVRGRVQKVSVVIELMTNQWNALLLEGEEERIRHLLWSRKSADRVLAVGQEYHPPPSSPRRGIEEPLTREEWQDRVKAGREEGGERKLLEEVAFVSPINLAALLEEDSPKLFSPGQPQAGFPLWNRLRTLEKLDPHLLERTGDKLPYPVLLHGFHGTPSTGILDAIQAISEEGDGEGKEVADNAEAITKRLERALHRARGRARGIGREMEEATDPQVPRERANLLLARLQDVPGGSSVVTLEGFGGEQVEVPLDPSLSPHENAQALYREAARLERARERLPPLLEEVEARIQELEHALERMSEGGLTPEEAEALLPPVPEKERPNGRTGDGKQDIRLPYRRYRSSGGLEIRVGRGGADNDALTFQHSRPNDIWMHAREVSGAHVILRWEGEGNPPPRDLGEAANLAALNSRARGSGVVPVDWTRRKHVRKPRKSRPGSVVLERAQTFFVEPNPEMGKRLAWEG